MSILWATNTPVLYFCWYILWISKPESAALFVLGRGICDIFFPENHIWCNTFAGVYGQHNSRSLSEHAETPNFLFKITFVVIPSGPDVFLEKEMTEI